MLSVETDHSWLSAHLFFQGDLYGPVCDRIILEVAAPFVRRCQRQNWISTYFFIRYRERGPHVRLRLYGERETLERDVRPALETHVEETLPEELRAYPYAGGSVSDGRQDASPLHWIPYEAEVDRYGGPDGVALAETFFYYSSETSLALLRQIEIGDRSARLGKGLLAMLVLLHVFLEDAETAAALAQHYSAGYLKRRAREERLYTSWMEAFDTGYDRQAGNLTVYVRTAWSHLDGSEPLTPVLDTYRTQLIEIRDDFKRLHAERRLARQGVVPDTWEHCVRMIVPSYLHMMNNRLGLSIPEESYLAYLITRALHPTVEQDTPASSFAA